MKRQTVEKQYQFLLEQATDTRLGLMSGQVWRDDPRRLAFILARYKFVSKMLSGSSRVLEVGCADGFGSRIVKQEVGELIATDFDPIFIEDARKQLDPKWVIDFRVHNMLEGPISENFDAAYCCDVLEHIHPSDERRFIKHLCDSINPKGCVIIGSPSLESQIYASQPSKDGHVNCKSAVKLKTELLQYFYNVFMFSMNDEVLHTGFFPMSHYLFALCCNVREEQ